MFEYQRGQCFCRTEPVPFTYNLLFPEMVRSNCPKNLDRHFRPQSLTRERDSLPSYPPFSFRARSTNPRPFHGQPFGIRHSDCPPPKVYHVHVHFSFPPTVCFSGIEPFATAKILSYAREGFPLPVCPQFPGRLFSPSMTYSIGFTFSHRKTLSPEDSKWISM